VISRQPAFWKRRRQAVDEDIRDERVRAERLRLSRIRVLLHRPRDVDSGVVADRQQQRYDDHVILWRLLCDDLIDPGLLDIDHCGDDSDVGQQCADVIDQCVNSILSGTVVRSVGTGDERGHALSSTVRR
jgi:hypothetical protein